jgi:hypothetical protein
MARIRFVLSLFAGLVLAGGIAHAQCRGGGAGQGTTGGTGTTAARGSGILTGITGSGGGSQLLTGPGSLAYDAMLSQMMAQQFAQQQIMLAMEQQKVKQEKLAARRYRAEHAREQVAESRARTRAALAVANGLPPAKQPTRSLVAYQSPRR